MGGGGGVGGALAGEAAAAAHRPDVGHRVRDLLAVELHLEHDVVVYLPAGAMRVIVPMAWGGA